MKRRIYKRYRIGKRGGQHYVVGVANRIVKKLKPYAKRINIAGSIRRGQEPNDIDIVMIPKDKDKVEQQINKLGKITASGEQQVFSKIQGIPVDVFYATDKEYGANLLTRTGPAGANISNRSLASDKGMLLNQHGLFKNNKRIAGETEESIYKALGKTYRPPFLRGKVR